MSIGNVLLLACLQNDMVGKGAVYRQSDMVWTEGSCLQSDMVGEGAVYRVIWYGINKFYKKYRTYHSEF